MEISGYAKGLDQQRRKEYIEKFTRIAAKDPYLLRCTEQCLETEKERLERQEREDEEFIKSVNFKNKSVEGKKIVDEEIIEDVESVKTEEPAEKKAKVAMGPPNEASFAAKSSSSLKGLVVKREQPLVLVKPREKEAPPAKAENTPGTSTSTKTPGGLSLLSAYSDSSEESE